MRDRGVGGNLIILSLVNMKLKYFFNFYFFDSRQLIKALLLNISLE